MTQVHSAASGSIPTEKTDKPAAHTPEPRDPVLRDLYSPSKRRVGYGLIARTYDMTDARYDSARATDQSNGRGWAFEPDDRQEFKPSAVVAIIAAVLVAASLIGMVLS